MASRGRPLTRSGMLNQFAGSAVSTATGFAIGSVIAPTLAPITQGLLNKTWALFPDRPVSAAVAAEGAARGYITPEQAEREARSTGYIDYRSKLLQDLAADPPTPAQLLELWRRGMIDEGAVIRGLKQGGLRDEWSTRVRQLKTILASPSDAIRWAVREAFNPPLAERLGFTAEFPEAFAEYAAQLGISREDAERHWVAHWQLVSPTELADMLHRKIIDQATYDDSLKALDYPAPWRPRLRELAKRIPPLTDMIRFAVRDAYDDEVAAKYGYDESFPAQVTADAALHGLGAEWPRRYWRAHFRLPSPTQAYRMLFRGEIDDGELDDLLRISDYPPFWRPKLAAIAHLVPGRVDLRRMFEHGVIDRAQVKAGYVRLGYTPEDAETLTVFAEELAHGPAATASHLAKAKTQLWTTTHRSYLSGEASTEVATDALEAAGVSSREIADVLAVWDHERALIRRQLTPAQVKKAYTKAVMNEATGSEWTRDDALAELIQRGYSHADATTYLDE